MTSINLQEKCALLYGQKGNKLYAAMSAIAQKDFCVATAWSALEVSIARGCSNVGRIFRFTEDYSGVFLPEDEQTITRIEDLQYQNLVKYLPLSRSRGEQKHCAVDD